MTRGIKLNDLTNGYKWSIQKFNMNDNISLLDFKKQLYIESGIDENFNVPIYINFTGSNCILIFKDGTKVLSEYNHIYKNNVFKFIVNDSCKTFAQIKNKLESIIFIDDYIYHPDFRYLWSENGLSGKIYQYKNEFYQNLLMEV